MRYRHSTVQYGLWRSTQPYPCDRYSSVCLQFSAQLCTDGITEIKEHTIRIQYGAQMQGSERFSSAPNTVYIFFEITLYIRTVLYDANYDDNYTHSL